jgi:hypothetical protein
MWATATMMATQHVAMRCVRRLDAVFVAAAAAVAMVVAETMTISLIGRKK